MSFKANTVVLNDTLSRLRTWMKAFRVHQWVKNLLLFIPIVMAHRLTEFPLIINCLTAFIAFNLCASGVYLLNDLIDLKDDQLHPVKKHRPLANGGIAISTVLVLIPLLFILGGIIAFMFLPVIFLAILGVYLVVTTGYTFYLKRLPLVDVLTLSGLYTLRILAGAAAVTIPVSFWLLAFSLFFFFGLALIKRYNDLQALQPKQKIGGRGYQTEDKYLVTVFGIASNFISLLVFVLYLSSNHVVTLYKYPAILWLEVPLLMFWMMRMWLVTHRGQMHDDPLVFAIKDKYSFLVGGLIAGILYLSTCAEQVHFLDQLIIMPK